MEQVASVVTPLILTANSPHDDLRATAMASLPDLILCAARSAERDVVKKLADYVIGQLMVALMSEEVLDNVKTAIQALKGCIGSAIGLLSEEQLLAICGNMVKQIGQSFQRRAVSVAEKRLEAQEDGELDEESEQELAIKAAEEEELHFIISEAFSEMIKTHPDAFLKIFLEHLMQWVQDLAHPSRLPSDRKIAVFPHR